MKPPAESLDSGSIPGMDSPDNAGLLKCSDIQELLSAYMMRELGDVQSRVVREHLRTCDACRREAAELQEMLDTLTAGSGELDAEGGVRLSEERRARILRAVFHPVLDWMYCHHRLVSTLAAVLVIALVLILLRNAAIFREQQIEEGIPIWRMFRSGKLPELVEKAMERQPAANPGPGAGVEGNPPTEPDAGENR